MTWLVIVGQYTFLPVGHLRDTELSVERTSLHARDFLVLEDR
jgi:hypothetical protein